MNAYEAARTIAATLIISQKGALTNLKIRKCVDEACQLPPASDLTTEQRELLTRELETTYQTVIGEERTLVGDGEGWEVWLPQRKGEISWRYWERFETLLRQGRMSPDVRGRLHRSTDRVLGYLGDPIRSGAWDRRGLVVGLVQSGKTSHYIGLINKAVDAGYKVVVVLTGFTESLRVQTQLRAEEGFLGYYQEPGARSGELRAHPVGVGLISPECRPGSVTTRRMDFNKAVADSFGIQVGGPEILFVIKKNVSVLRNLLNWISSFGNATDSKGRRFVKDVPLLVIDDESDVGSIDTRKGAIVDDDPDIDHEPSRINEQIRKLLSLFDQSSYVGYTATPFANVLIHDGGFTEELGADLFPRSFVVSLPTPSDHIGPSVMFGGELEDGGAEDGLPVVRSVPITESTGQDAWIPPVHKKTHRPRFEARDEIPPSLRKAILSFILVCAARRLRKVGTKHNSMLVHVTRFNDVQEKVDEQIDKEVTCVVDRLRSRTADRALLDEIKKIWTDDFIVTTRAIARRDGAIFQNSEHPWDRVKGELLAAASAIQVRTINGLAGEILDYEAHKDGLSVIAIGGDKLSRGLTLEGLSVSYFLRCSRMYDTLMQMGRWFGYRPGYLDLCRLYTTTELSEWFRQIATATEELRNEFDLMANSGGTPKDFGLRVRSHSELMVTSSVKMRHGATVQVTFQGDIVETVTFRRDETTVRANWQAVEGLVRALEAGGGVECETRRNCARWSGVSHEKIEEFLQNYTEHENAVKARTFLLRKYIEEEAKHERLTNWTVFVSAGESPRQHRLGKKTFPLVSRSWYLGRGASNETDTIMEDLKRGNQYRIRRIVNPPDEAVDLTHEDRELALQQTLDDYRIDPGRRKTAPGIPGGRFLRQRRDSSQGLLILYPLAPGDGKAETDDVPIAGFAISFPAVAGDEASKVTYMVNNVYQRQELGYS